MFDPWCPQCAARVLLTARRIVRLSATAGGHRATLRCWCGELVAVEVTRTRPVPRAPGAAGPAGSPGHVPSVTAPAA